MPSRDQARRNLRLLWCGQFLNTAALMMLVPVMPFYVERLGVEGTGAVAVWAGIALAAPALMLAIVTPLWGRVGDRVGRHWMVVRALIGLALSMLIIAAAQSPLALVAGRLVQGTIGGVVEAAAAFVSGESPEGEMGRSLGRSYTATASGAVVGPVAGGLFIGGEQIETLMVSTALLAGVCAIVCALNLRGLGTTRIAQAPPADPRRGSRSGTRGIGELLAAAFLIHLAIYGSIPPFALHVRDQLEGADAGAWVGALHAMTWGAAVPGALWWGRRNDVVSTPAASVALASAGCAASVLLQALPVDPEWLTPLRLVQGFCFAALAQSVLMHVAERATPARRSAQTGVANSFLLAGQVAGPLLAAGALLVVSPAVTLVALGLCAALAASLASRAVRLARARPPRAHARSRSSGDLNRTGGAAVARAQREPGLS